MKTCRDLPDEALIPTRIVPEARSFDRVAAFFETPAAPTEALRELMRGQNR